MNSFYTNGEVGPRKCPIHGYEIQPGHVGCWRCEDVAPETRPMVERLGGDFLQAVEAFWNRWWAWIIGVPVVMGLLWLILGGGV